MEKYLIAIDLDGTLMLSLDEYDKETFEYLKKLKQDGHIIMLATGRPYRSSIDIYNNLGLNTPLINYDGAFVTNPTDSNYPQTDLRIKKELLFDLCEKKKDIIDNAFCEIHDDVYVIENTDFVNPFLHPENAKIFEGNFKDTLHDDPHGALFFLSDENWKVFEDYIKENYQGIFLTRDWHFGGANIVEIYSPLVCKSNGVKEAIEYYNIDPKNTIAIGDGLNDIKLFQAVNISVAMGSSLDKVKKHAKYITLDNKHNGVLEFLKKYFEKEAK